MNANIKSLIKKSIGIHVKRVDKIKCIPRSVARHQFYIELGDKKKTHDQSIYNTFEDDDHIHVVFEKIILVYDRNLNLIRQFDKPLRPMYDYNIKNDKFYTCWQEDNRRITVRVNNDTHFIPGDHIFGFTNDYLIIWDSGMLKIYNSKINLIYKMKLEYSPSNYLYPRENAFVINGKAYVISSEINV